MLVKGASGGSLIGRDMAFNYDYSRPINHMHSFLSNISIHPLFNTNDDLAGQTFELGHEWIITSLSISEYNNTSTLS